MATVSNLSDRVLYIPGRKEPLEPRQIGAHSDASESTLRGHLFAKAGYITVEGASVAAEAPAQAPAEPEPEEPEPAPEKTPLELAKEEAAETQDMDRLQELANDDRKTVAKIAQARLDEMGAD